MFTQEQCHKYSLCACFYSVFGHEHSLRDATLNSAALLLGGTFHVFRPMLQLAEKIWFYLIFDIQFESRSEYKHVFISDLLILVGSLEPVWSLISTVEYYYTDLKYLNITSRSYVMTKIYFLCKQKWQNSNVYNYKLPLF